jgi:hypothetical protein
MHGTMFLLTLCSACSSLRTVNAVTALSGLCRALGFIGDLSHLRAPLSSVTGEVVVIC